MSKTVQKIMFGRKVKEEKIFEVPGTFQSMYAANRWLTENGYSYGSTSKNRLTAKDNPVAITIGPYDVPQKWNNLDAYDKKYIDGVMISDDWREGFVKVILFEV